MNHYFALFKSRDFSFLTIADSVSVLGEQIGWVAILWFATLAAKNPGTVGIIGLAYGLPGVFLGAVIGNVLDCVPPKIVLVLANVLLGCVFLGIPFLNSVHELSQVTLFLMVLVAGCLTPFTNIGWMVIVPRIVEEEELGLANSVLETIWNGASLLGPMVGGILIAQFGSPTAVLADGISFWVAAACVFLLKSPCSEASDPNSPKPNSKKHFWSEVWDGFKILYRLKPVWWITVSAIVILVADGQLEISLPLFTHHELYRNAFVLGTFWTTYFVTSLVGSAISGLITKYGRSGIWMSCMFIGWGISFVPMIWFHTLWMVYISMALAGFLFSGAPPLARTAVQRLVPRAYQGRVMGIRGSLIAAGMPAGSYLSGLLAQWAPSSIIIGYTGVVVMVFGFLLLSIRNFRTI